jgi:hypothetical protein
MQNLKPMPLSRRVRKKILSVCIGIAAFLMCVNGGCSPDITGLEECEKAAMREIREIAENAAYLLNVYMDARITEMLVCAKLGGPLRDSLIKPEARTDANRILEEWLQICGGHEAILLLDNKGVCLASAPEGLVNQDLSNNEAFKGAVTGKLTITDAHKSEILTTLDPKSIAWTVVIAVPVQTKDEMAGVLISCVNWSKVRALMTSIRIGTPFVQMYSSGRAEFSTGHVYVLNQKNQIIIHSVEHNYGVSLRNPRINCPGLDDAIRNKAANKRYEIRGPITGSKSMMLEGLAYPKGYGNFAGLGWVVGASVSEDELIGAPWWMQLFR